MIGCSRTIQKQVEVNDAVGRVFNESGRPMITSKCLEKSLSKEELNKLLSKGVKVNLKKILMNLNKGYCIDDY